MNDAMAIGAGETLQADVTVVGAALVGATLATALASCGFSVVLIDKRSLAPSGSRIPVSQIHTTAMSLSSINILKSLGLWRYVEAAAVPINAVHVSQVGHFGSVRLSALEQGVDALGAIVPNQLYSDALSRIIDSSERITTLAPADLIEITGVPLAESDDASARSTDSVVTYCQANGQHYTIKSNLLLAVDGVKSQVRTMLGIESRVTDYEQSAVLANVETSELNRGIAFERFTDTGPMACLPLGGHMNSVVCSIDADEHQRFAEMNSDELCKAFQQRFGFRLGRFVSCGPQHVMPLRLTEAARQRQGRVLLMGNAARTLHPVAGQGFNLALRDVGSLLELMQSSADSTPGLTFDTQSILSRFEADRRQDQSSTVAATDTLARLFRGSSPTFSHLRGLGLLGIEHVPGLRQRFARQAMGITSRLPDLSVNGR